MANNVTIKCMVIGQAPVGAGLKPVYLELETECITVRDLIARAVTEQIQELLEQHRIEAGLVHLALARQYLSLKDIQKQAEMGRISLPVERKDPSAAIIDTDKEIKKAHSGFEAQAFQVLLDGVPLESLDENIVLKRETKIVFLRLTPLVGG
ncbi:MAG: hypothetical protein ISR72_10665 [Methylobacter sp.]|nr:hypothetical protein [Methylobacter sp.]